jgi:hypothetical protein
MVPGWERQVIPGERKLVPEDRRDCYWLYVVTDCDAEPCIQLIKDPASLPWHQVKKVDHYWFSMDALTRPIQR